jgi:HK97 gp10 family phage protein
MIDVKVRGLAELKATLATLPQAMQNTAIKGMVAAGASVIRQEAILRAPAYAEQVPAGHPPAGTLKNAVYQSRLISDCTPSHEVWIVNVRKGKKFQAHKKGGQTVNADAYYATWVEYGTVKMSARPFMRPAFEAKKSAAVDAMGTYLAFWLPQAVEKAKKGTT